MDKYFIKGGEHLFGAVEVSSAKNAYLPILAGTILCDGVITLENCPQFLDVQNMIKILENLGGKSYINHKTLTLDMAGLKKWEILGDLASKIRSSFFCVGALLGRFKKARVAYPGGCEIGARPIDLHLKALKSLNVKILDRHGYINFDGKNMRGADVHLDFPSVGATENIMLASCTIKGTTKIYNSAKEPEIIDLQNFLNRAGAKIRGAGSDVIEITGVKKLHNAVFRPMPDRIIAGTYILASVICGGEVIIKNCPSQSLEAFFSKIDPKVCKIKKNASCALVSVNGRHCAVSKLETMPYPGFPTDLQSQFTAMLATARGTSVVIENLFETRFKYVPELLKMGANITTNGKTAIVRGVPKLYGAEVFASDLRGGAALVLASLMAEGYTTVGNISHIERGYDTLVEDLSALGANIRKIRA